MQRFSIRLCQICQNIILLCLRKPILTLPLTAEPLHASLILILISIPIHRVPFWALGSNEVEWSLHDSLITLMRPYETRGKVLFVEVPQCVNAQPAHAQGCVSQFTRVHAPTPKILFQDSGGLDMVIYQKDTLYVAYWRYPMCACLTVLKSHPKLTADYWLQCELRPWPIKIFTMWRFLCCHLQVVLSICLWLRCDMDSQQNRRCLDWPMPAGSRRAGNTKWEGHKYEVRPFL